MNLVKIPISGCIVTFNNINTIDSCVQSILKWTQGYDFQLYIIDNGSIDGTVQFLEKKYPNIVIIQNLNNIGFGGGHNVIIEQLNSLYHFVINPDIVVEQDFIAPLIRFMEEHPNVGMITPKVINMDGNEQHLPKEYPTIRFLGISKIPGFQYLRKEYTRSERKIVKPEEINFCTGCFFCIRTNLFREIGGFDNRYFLYFEDADLTRKVKDKNKSVIFYPNVSVKHRWKRDNVRSIKGIWIEIKSMIKYFNKWGWKF